MVTNHTPLLHAAHFSGQGEKNVTLLIKEPEETEWRGKHVSFIQGTAQCDVLF